MKIVVPYASADRQVKREECVDAPALIQWSL
jgi:hypothetical protein